MPWRKTTDPYHIWLSEIILQQTRVAQGLPYYEAFLEAFPTVFDLAAAEEQKVLKLWQGLGYYSRARNLHTTAKFVANTLDGVFPSTYKGLLELKGVGDYTASAIASICFGEAVPVVDGNVYRVLSRYFNINTPINSTAGVKEFKKLAISIMDHDEPATYNQAIMEFGALQCKPKSPYCLVCPLQDSCVALSKGMIHELPVKLKKGTIKKRYFNYIVFMSDDDKTMIKQRLGNGIWKNMYEFPLIEGKMVTSEIQNHESFKSLVGSVDYEFTVYDEKEIVHKLSHQHLYTKFYIVKQKELKKGNGDLQIINIKDIGEYPVPILLGNFMNAVFSIP